MRQASLAILLLPALTWGQTNPYPTNLRVPAEPGASALVAADFNSDGKMDLAVANTQAKSISILLGNGSGGFQNAVGSPIALAPSFSNGPVAIAAGDFNRDGKADLAFVGPPAGSLFVWPGTGGGQFLYAPAPVAPVRTNVGKMAVGDFNSDGNLDILVDEDGSGRQGFTGTAYLGNGAGGFTDGQRTRGTTAFGDFNGDGKMDYVSSIIVGGNSVPTIGVSIADDQGSFTTRSYAGLVPNVGGSAVIQRISVADYDRDGALDVVATVQVSPYGYILGWRGDGAGGFIRDFTHSAQPPGTVLGVGRAIAVGDLDRTAALDWVEAGPDDSLYVALLGQSPNNAPLEIFRYDSGLGPTDLALADFNGDGQLDVAAANAGSGDVTLLLSGPAAGSAQSINFPSLSSKSVEAAPFALFATASSGLTVTLTSNTPLTCRVSAGFVTVLGKGSCVITARQPGNGTTQPATPISRSFGIFGLPQVISVGAISSRLLQAGPFQLEVSTNAGLPVTATPNSSFGQNGACSVEGLVVTPLRPGQCSLFLSQEGNERYEATNVTYSFPITTITKLTQTLDFPSIADRPFSTTLVPVTATANSGLFPNYESRTPTVCTAGFPSNGTVQIRLVSPGVCTLTATVPETESYLGPVSVTRSFTVTPVVKQPQTLTIFPIADVSLASLRIFPTNTGTGGVFATFTSNTPAICTAGAQVTLVAAGVCSITGVRPGNDFYLPSDPQTISFNIIDGPTQSQFITFPSISNYARASRPVTLIATASSSLTVTLTSGTPGVCSLSGVTLTLNAVGTCSVVASQAGNGIFKPAASITRSFSVTAGTSSQPQSIVAFPVGDQALTVGTLSLEPVASSGLAVTFVSTTPVVCSVAGSLVRLLAAGQCSVTATQAGDSAYAPAVPKTVSFQVTPVRQFQRIILGQPLQLQPTDPPFNILATATSGLPVTITAGALSSCSVEGTRVTPLASGFCQLTATQAGDSVYAPASPVTSLFAILPAPGPIEIRTPRVDAMRNAASYAVGPLAPTSYAAIFGARLNSPTVTLRDSAGGQYTLQPVYSGETQINVLLPSGIAAGSATLTVTTGEGSTTLPVLIATAAPGLFSADGTGVGLAAAQVLIVNPDKTVSTHLVADGPISVTLGTDVFLVLYGTGIRGRQGPAVVTIAGQSAEVLYAGEQGSFPGLDQVNVRVPSFSGGPPATAQITLSIDGTAANPVLAQFQ